MNKDVELANKHIFANFFKNISKFILTAISFLKSFSHRNRSWKPF